MLAGRYLERQNSRIIRAWERLFIYNLMKQPYQPSTAKSPAPQGLEDLAILPKCTAEIAVLHRDSDFWIIDKPYGLLSVPGRHPANRDSVLVRMQALHPGAAIVHRLDFDTSGLMVIPLNPAALSGISKQFQARSVEKTYTAIVAGQVTPESGQIDLPIAADPDNRPKYKICHQTGKPSVTDYKVLETLGDASRLSLHPLTGRSHQLRLHLQAIGHPIWGDVFYADAVTMAKSPRLLLHATLLRFTHPANGARMEFYSAPAF